MSRIAAVLGLVFGIFLALAETARNWGNWQWWPFWLVDFIASGLLIMSSILTLRGSSHARRLLCGAWGFTSAMFYMSFWSHIEKFQQAADGNVPQGPLTVIIGILWVITIVGFFLSLVPTGESRRH